MDVIATTAEQDSTESRFAEKVTPYLRDLMESSEAIREMYQLNPELENLEADTSVDLLNEKTSTPVFGTVKKYEGQLLALLSYTCVSNCRYCERQDRVGVGLDSAGRLTKEKIDNIIDYVAGDETIYEVIASGGDPLTNPKGLRYLFEELSKLEHVKVLRIHTRFPLQNPDKVDLKLMADLSQLREAVYFSLHIDHPDELTPKAIKLIAELKAMGYIMITQTVFLKGINDSVETLKDLFLKLFELGVRPYYIYHGQEVTSTRRFVMDLDDEVNIVTDLRNQLSGLAFPQHVIDIPGASGKVVVPSNHWSYDSGSVSDFKGKRVTTSDWNEIAQGKGH
ncbi:KamA family radical SAM protein [Marinobacter sp. JSM 1782161]|uniref:KamA family radical SAM protein n=1 Tax=Marinobacter sp. JSM 1782161 TaxID=2685906 RepID=UPI001402E75E|nr:radical SAM protein [Marinobacter sp. JSM 1782161]